MISFNYRDGAGDLDDWLTPREKTHALKELPSLWEYSNYIFCLQSSVAGPSFEYKKWREFVDRKGDIKSMKPFS